MGGTHTPTSRTRWNKLGEKEKDGCCCCSYPQQWQQQQPVLRSSMMDRDRDRDGKEVGTAVQARHSIARHTRCHSSQLSLSSEMILATLRLTDWLYHSLSLFLFLLGFCMYKCNCNGSAAAVCCTVHLHLKCAVSPQLPHSNSHWHFSIQINA